MIVELRIIIITFVPSFVLKANEGNLSAPPYKPTALNLK